MFDNNSQSHQKPTNRTNKTVTIINKTVIIVTIVITAEGMLPEQGLPLILIYWLIVSALSYYLSVLCILFYTCVYVCMYMDLSPASSNMLTAAFWCSYVSTGRQY